MTCHFVPADLKKLFHLTGISTASCTISSCVLTTLLPNYNTFFVCIFNSNYLEIFVLSPKSVCVCFVMYVEFHTCVIDVFTFVLMKTQIL